MRPMAISTEAAATLLGVGRTVAYLEARTGTLDGSYRIWCFLTKCTSLWPERGVQDAKKGPVPRMMPPKRSGQASLSNYRSLMALLR